MTEKKVPMMALEEFCFRQFDDPNAKGAIKCDKAEFTAAVNQAFENGAVLQEGYAPFCKHIFVKNFTPAEINCIEITDQNRHLLRSGYEARTAHELPVLDRWFAASDVTKHKAAWLDCILYSREQIDKEDAATGEDKKYPRKQEPWGIVSVKAQDVDHELPMAPITMMRNALGEAEGGSGVPLSREKYNESVAFWSRHANIKDGQ